MTDRALFNVDFFKKNREKLRKKSPASLIIIAANGRLQKTADQQFPFRQNSNFWYLCGVEEADFTLVIDGKNEYLIAPKLSHYLKAFYGDNDFDKIRQLSGINEILDEKTGWLRLSESIKKTKKIGSLKPPQNYIESYGIYTNPAMRRLIKRIRSYNKNLEIDDLRLAMARLRMIKQAPELLAIKKAIKLTSDALTQVQSNLANYDNESDIATELTYYFNKNRTTHGFDPIVANGKNAATLHYESNNQNIDKNKITLIDTGAIYQNYSADLSRAYCANPSSRQKAVHRAVVEVQSYAMSLLKPGVDFKDYEKKVAMFMGEKLKQLGLIEKVDQKIVRQWYPQMTSHHLGLDLHDATDFDEPLRAGMVITVEPGIYIKDESIGVRIEDDVLITEKGIENLSVGLSNKLN